MSDDTPNKEITPQVPPLEIKRTTFHEVSNDEVDDTIIFGRQDILDLPEMPEIRLVKVPEWGPNVGVYVRGMSGGERDQFEQSLIEGRGKNRKTNLANYRAKIAVATICDKLGRRIFRDVDHHIIGKKPAAGLERVVDAAQELSGLTQSAVDDLTGNSENGQNEDSGFDWSGTA